MTNSTKGLNDFEGKPVMASTIKVTNAGDGLSKSMKVEPGEFHTGDTVYLLIRSEVSRVAYEPIDRDAPAGPQRRVHTFKAGTALVVPEELVDTVREQIADMDDRIARAQEEEAGIQRIDFDQDDPAETEGEGADEGAEDGEWETPVAEILGRLTKDQLRELAARHDVKVKAKATGSEMVASLSGISGIAEEALQMNASNVVPIGKGS